MRSASAKVRVAAVAGRQWGRITAAQLVALGLDRATISRWLRQGYLHRVLPRVYAVGHSGRNLEGDLAAALLYAGPGAMLSHATAAWWFGLVDAKPRTIHITTPRRRHSLPGIRIHERRTARRVLHKGLPVTAVGRALADYAVEASWPKLRRALANADYRRMLDLQAVDRELRQGRRGSARLRQALEGHRPELARVRSDLEVAFFELCEHACLPLPQINARVHSWTVDFFWPDLRLVVEVDGCGNHRSPAQVRRDRKMDLALRSRGLTVHRYSDEQLAREARAVVAELRAGVGPIPPGRSA